MNVYTKEIEKFFSEKGISVGDLIKIKTEKEEIEGRLMPRTYYNPDIVVVKLSNGYNIGISFSRIKDVEKISSIEAIEKEEEKIEFDPKKPKISILSTGGTIASKVDYRTGGVEPLMTASDLFSYVPELKDIANISPKTIMKVFSENMSIEHYEKMTKEIAKEIENESPDAVIIPHGTDTMHYSSSALSFSLQNLPIPVIFVGAQRSSDRGSSDAAVNLISSALFGLENVSGVFVVMHESMDDKTCLSHLGTRVRKMHTSRRDTFKTINTKPVARIYWREKKVEFINKEFVREKNKERTVDVKPNFEKKVALIKIYPGIEGEIIDYLVEKKYKGLVIEGTGLGHAPEYIFDSIKNAAENMVVCMTSQTIYGRINMNVYSTGRDLMRMGVIPCEMLPETAFVKLSWALGNFEEEEVKNILTKNISGEIVERIV